ncbi:2-keto-4-pentenoate hydratase/2-oxohepta-3-ene-1,7-dioic acid hydratase (Catechol pathway) [Pseudomonas sp. JV551A1]|uniref:2-keto-4-pentenoate hydratase/2-oxohepta-3-ene-1,7-dioic acid hydratase (Catechol pathway) n=1 Tax=Pseudomonas inefficax TaxID=2078786 RepID=A0AAQ1SUK0_9PSED|nr:MULTISPECIES: fumarylacetoacetate hydrolase family protein [Pseudomonas]SPO54619.1 2-keto-4-pentenoate hydratase/2-oxohepta-3-ene-1,7-dioic acid hydratase (Catechol pathway) [Pseudomonas sp. JV551A1]SPO62099.1 2-keto-4-pentenoate hydratase/2-oxohepta-3-ene-1,7-dioic acid hydratase (Catechol pathway) [Pseudomonas inefficax]
MKLASLKSGGRDGTLVVVDRRLERAVRVPHIATTLQQALERWSEVAAPLALVTQELEAGVRADAFAFDTLQAASPLPRAYQFLDGSVYLHHMEKARKARGAAMPPNYKTDPLMYQGLSDAFCGPHDPLLLPDESLELDYEAEIAIVTDEVPMGTTVEQASSYIRLVMLLNDYTLRALTRTELPKGFGFLQAKPTSAFSPVAVTPDELGAAFDGERFTLRVRSSVNGQRMGEPDAGRDMFFTYPQLIAHAARTRTLSAGTIIGAGSISNQDESVGFGCIAEARIHEQGVHGAPRTPWLRFGDRVCIEAFDVTGASVFGAINQVIEKGVRSK